MSLLPESTDYTSKDFDAIDARLEALIRSVFPQWTDFNVLTFGNIIKEMYAFILDVLVFYQDAQAGESRIVSATQRASIIKLARLIGFELPGATAATANIRIFLSAVTPGSVPFPAGTVARTREVSTPIRFQLLSAAEIPAGADPPEIFVDVENSEPRQDLFASDDLPDQTFVLSSTPFLDGSLDGAITTTQGAWDEVDSFLDSTPTDRHFTVEVDQNDRATVRFGDGTNGLIPTGAITMDYKIGGGLSGNAEAGEIQVVEGQFQDSFANPVTVAADNAVKASGGDDRQGIETAKILAPASLRVLNRTVAREDYEINALRVAGVARALMLTSDQDPGLPENAGTLSVIPIGGGVATQTLLDAVLEKVTVDFPNTITFKTFTAAADFLTIDVASTVFLRQGAKPATVKQAILDNLTTFFAVSNPDDTPNVNVDFGFNFKDVDGNPAGEIAFSDVFNVVRDTLGVRKISDAADGFTLNGLDRDVPMTIREFPVLGQVTIKNGDTGLPL